MREVAAILGLWIGTGSGSWRHGVSILTIDDRTLEIADVDCTDQDLVVSLKDGRKIVTPLWLVSSTVPCQRRSSAVDGSSPGPAAASTGRTSTRT